jgi:hypothetical protein
MTTIPEPCLRQIEDAYRRMADEGRYRPAAPSDGLGNITVPLESLDLDKEASEYARQWWEQEDECEFTVGCCNYPTRAATIFAIEAARSCAALTTQPRCDCCRWPSPRSSSTAGTGSGDARDPHPPASAEGARRPDGAGARATPRRPDEGGNRRG